MDFATQPFKHLHNAETHIGIKLVYKTGDKNVDFHAVQNYKHAGIKCPAELKKKQFH
jgi:hypothetical protein